MDERIAWIFLWTNSETDVRISNPVLGLVPSFFLFLLPQKANLKGKELSPTENKSLRHPRGQCE